MRNIDKMREAIKAAYPKSSRRKTSEFWQEVDRYSDAQVVAVYRNLKDQGRIGK
jgi:hypothetical protein